MELYGNSIWNNATPNTEKAVMLTSKENLDRVVKALDEAGANYCYFVRDNSVAIAFAKIAVQKSEIENLRKIAELKELSVQEPRSSYVPKSSIIGNTPYRDIQNKHYQKLETDLALKVANALSENGVSFSGRIYGKSVTLTVEKSEQQELERVIGDIVQVRNSYKHKIDNINRITRKADELIPEQQIIMQTLVDMCYPKAEAFSEVVLDGMDTVRGLSVSQTQEYVELVKEVYGSLSNESEYIFANIERLDAFKKMIKNNEKLSSLTYLKGFNSEQKESLKSLIERNVSDSILSIIDYNFSHENIMKIPDVVSNGYQNLLEFVSEIKNIDNLTLDNLFSNSEYQPDTAELTYDKYSIQNSSAFVTKNRSIYTIPINTSIGILNRLAEHGLLPNDEMTNVIFETDNNNWNRLIIPDRFGNKYNNIDISEVLTQDELSVVRTVIDDVIEREQARNKVKQTAQEQNLPFSNGFSNGIDDEDKTAVFDGTMSLFDYRKQELFQELDEIVNSDGSHYIPPIDLLEVFDGAVIHDWEHNAVKQNRIKKALNSILSNENKTEDTFVAISRYYGVNIGRNLTDKEQEENEIVKDSDTYKIYQLTDDESNRYKRFERLSNQPEPVNAADYQLVYEGDLSEIDGENKLERLFIKFNTDRPDDFKGHSLSVSDVIVTKMNGKDTAYFCDRFGFSELPDFFKERQQEKAIVENQVDDVLDKINAEEIRQELENSGIVNGEVTDINKLNSDTFIRQVNSDVKAIEQKQESTERNKTVYLPKAENFRITDNEIGSGTTMQRFNNNLAAIRTLKALEADDRQATPEEQEILSRYVGWGGLAEFFKESNPHYQELKDLLTEDEYISARATTLDSFYTSPAIIDSIYTVLQNSGFSGGNILEPSMGIGNFFGRMPQEMQKQSKLFGVEIDGLTGRIAKQLYPQAHIDIKGFEKTQFKNNSFDVAIGNIPFGDFSLQYDKQSLKIHDYFFMQALDNVKYGGIVAFITSKGTLDKRDTSFRKQLSQKADLIGAVRLPNNAFKAAGTEVTADIVFLQKRQSPPEKAPDWVNIGVNDDGLPINEYFVQHSDMVLGEIVQGNKMFGRNDDTMCVPFENVSLSELLTKAVGKIEARIDTTQRSVAPIENSEVKIPENIRNYSYFEHNNNIYSVENNNVVGLKDSWKRSYSAANIERAKAYIQVRDTVRELLAVQQETTPDVEDRIKMLQAKLNTQYDHFYKKYGLMHSRFNAQLFRNDCSYPLMQSLEDKIDRDKLIKKSDIFYKRTIRVPQVVESVDTPQEALALSLAEQGKVDLAYMSKLTDIPVNDIITELQGQGEIFPVPELSTDDNIVYQTASEYLSGDIYAKLNTAKCAAENNDVFEGNISALEAAIPTPLTAGEIDIECGATWIPQEIYQQFMYETFKTPDENRADRPARFPWQQRYKRDIEIAYSPHTNKWNISNKSADHSVTAKKTFGTKDKNAYTIFENVLNLHIPNITKMVPNPNNPSEDIKVMDMDATKLVKRKAEAIKKEFKDWIFKDPDRRRMLVDMYNRQFNCVRPREYDGSHLQFHGMNASIELHQHQKNAIAHAIYGGNTLFAHCVGAGKTFEMIATAMESKRLGLCSKSLFAVPNHLTEQVGADFMKLYPSANILVATKKDFTKQNRSKLLAKIATGNYDAVIIGHSQLGMIPISPDRQAAIYRGQINDIMQGIRELKDENGESFQIKQMERTRKSLEAKLEKLSTSRKDNTVYFEELGIDKLFVDEAHEFKNLMSVTKLQNVSGISGRTSQRATDLFMKCQYLDEKTGGNGVVFATGTPVSNSVTELHTMMRYLQYDFLEEHGMQNFDNWVSVFGKQKTEYELAPTGDKFKARTRIASYANMPELMTMFKQCADVRTSDSLKLPVPDCELHIVNAEPTPLQQDMVAELSARADDVQSGAVDPTEDNMLKITGDGRKVGLDPRLVNPDLDDNPNTKLNQCVNNVFQIWQDTAEDKLTQIIFCDLGVPKPNQQADKGKEIEEQSMSEIDSLEESGTFCVYDDIKSKLAEMGVPKSEIAFIHEAKSEAQKSELFEKVRSGEVRVLIGSTAKMGTGTNVQDRLVALHDLDVPWRPADLEQRRGRMVRQGNINDKVHLYRYVTKGTFDAYSYQLLETKQRFISQVITSKTPARTCTDVDQEALTYSEIKALCTGDERIKEKLTLENRVKELKLFQKEYNGTHYELEDKVAAYPQKREQLCDRIERIEHDYEKCKSIPFGSDGMPIFAIKIKGIEYSDKKEAAEALKAACDIVYTDKGKSFEVGEINGFKISAFYDRFNEVIRGKIKGEAEYSTAFSTMPSVNINKLEKLVVGIEKVLSEENNKLAQMDIDIQSAQEILAKPFEYAQELADKSERLEKLTDELNAEAANRLQTAEKPQRTHYFGKAAILSSTRKEAPNQAQEQSKEQDKEKDKGVAI